MTADKDALREAQRQLNDMTEARDVLAARLSEQEK